MEWGVEGVWGEVGLFPKLEEGGVAVQRFSLERKIFVFFSESQADILITSDVPF